MLTSRRNPVAQQGARDSNSHIYPTVYPTVAMQKVGNEIREDHLVFISDDKKHDVPFVEECNEILHHHSLEEDLKSNHDIEYNNDC